MTGHDHGASQSLLLRPLPTSLPKVEVWRVTPAEPAPRHSETRASIKFGYNDDDEWQQPSTYGRWVQPTEAELAKQVEYDMDEVDKAWLDSLNAERRESGIDAISYDFFEVTMDKLEKEWFDLETHIPKPAANAQMEDGKCMICDEGDCETSNAIVFCDGCNLAVHQDCYGVPYIPEGQWLCRKCTVSPDRPVACALCPNEFGAFKQTTNGKWAHLLCAIWINETGVSNTVYMEPVDGIDLIPKGRWKLVCYLCKRRTGACIQCSKANCFTAYHATCARDYGLYLKLGTSSGTTHDESSPGHNISYCGKHGPREPSIAAEREVSEELPTPEQAALMKKRKLIRYDEMHGNSRSGTPQPVQALQALSSKQNRAYTKSFTSAGPPIIPHFIAQRVSDYLKPLAPSKGKRHIQMVNTICKYWSLKREGRRGAPLLKRLHLEPWTASSTSRQATDLEKEKKLELILQLRNDLEKVRGLVDLIKKREKEKLRKSELMLSTIRRVIFPHTDRLRAALDKLRKLDAKQLFAEPVSQADVPDYFDVIKHPMDWQTMRFKLDRLEYVTAFDFESDVKLIIANALTYNTWDSEHGKAALKLRQQAPAVFSELETLDEDHSSLRTLYQACLSTMGEDFIKDMCTLYYPTPSPSEVIPLPELPAVNTGLGISADIASRAAVRAEALAEARRAAAAEAASREPATVPRAGIPEIHIASTAAPRETNKRKAAEMDLDSAPGFRKSNLPAASKSDQPAAASQSPTVPINTSSSKFKSQRTKEIEASLTPEELDKREKKLARKRELGKIAREKKKMLEAGAAPSQGPEVPSTQSVPNSVHVIASRPPADVSPLLPQPPSSSLPPVPPNPSEREEVPLPDSAPEALHPTHGDKSDPVPQPPPVVLLSDSGSTTPAEQKRHNERSGRRKPHVLPDTGLRTSEWGEVVDRPEVSNHSSFLLFNSGWRLPDGLKRRRHASNESGGSSIVPKRGRSVKSETQSPRSVSAKLPDETSLPNTTSSVPNQAQVFDLSDNESDLSVLPEEDCTMDLDPPDVPGKLVAETPRTSPHPEDRTAAEADVSAQGFDIDELEDRKAERNAISDISDLSDVESIADMSLDHKVDQAASDSANHQTPSTSPPAQLENSVLSSPLSDIADALIQRAPAVKSESDVPDHESVVSIRVKRERSPSSRARRYRRASSNLALETKLRLEPSMRYHSVDELEDEELVWAKESKNGILWPADVILDRKRRQVPRDVVQADPRKKGFQPEAPEDEPVLIQWAPFQEGKFSWVPVRHLSRFRESDEYDQALLDPSVLPKQHKNKAHALKRAFKDMLHYAETPEEAAIREASEVK